MSSKPASQVNLEHPAKGLTTCVPQHGQDVKRPLVKLILKQAGVTEDDFQKLL